MIRPFTLVCMVSAFGAGLYLYQSKHQAQMLDREIERTIKQTEMAKQRIGILRADWALMNEPERLADLARAHTTLQTLKPTQFVAANDLSSRLPAPGPMPGQAESPPPSATLPPMAQIAPTAPTSTAPASTVPTSTVAQAMPTASVPAVAAPAKPTQVATAEPKPDIKPDAKPETAARKPPPKPAQVAHADTPAPSSAPTRLAHAAPAHETDDAATAPGTVGAAVMRARMQAAYHPPAYVQPVIAPAPSYAPPAASYAPPPAYAQPAYAAPATGSVLGGSRSLPPPVPFAAR